MSRTVPVTSIGVAMCLAVIALLPQTVAADEPDFGHARFEGGKGETTVSVRVEGRSDGFDLYIGMRQKRPGVPDRYSPAAPVPASTEAGGSAVGNANAGTSPVQQGFAGAARLQTRPWTEGSTIHEGTPDAQHTTIVPIMATAWGPTGDGTNQQLRQTPEFLGYYTYVNGEYQGINWQPLPPGPALPPGTVPPLPADVRPGGGGGLDPRSVALDILAHIPLPDIRLRMNPALGLVALPSWYWAEGYGGGTFGESRTIVIPPANPNDPNDHGVSFTVEVRVWGSRYDWEFGDGKSATTRSLGKAYPAESDIQHTYEHSSLPFPGGFPVRMTVEYAAEFSVNGGGAQGLPPVRRTYGSAFRVQEVQPVLVQRR